MTHVPGSAVGRKPSIIGRRAELAALTQALRFLGDRESPIVVLSGEPGIGKTRLLDELCARADDQGHLVLRGRAAEMEQVLPFAVVVDALGDFGASLGADRLGRLVGVQAEELAPIVPELEGLGGVGCGPAAG